MITVETLEREIRSRGGSITLAGSITAATLAEVLGASIRTIEGWRAEGIGPPSYTASGQPSGRRFYLLTDVAEHINASLARH